MLLKPQAESQFSKKVFFMSMDSKFVMASSNIRWLGCCSLVDKNCFQEEKVPTAQPFGMLLLGSFIVTFYLVITYFQCFKSSYLFAYFCENLIENYFVAFSKVSAFASLFDYFKNFLDFDAGSAGKDFILKSNILERCCMDTSFLKIDPDSNLDIDFESNLYSIGINFNVGSH